MGTARVDHQVRLERPGLLVVPCENVHPGAVALRLSRGAQSGHLGALQEGHIMDSPAQLPDGRLDESAARVELPQTGMGAPAPPMWPERRGVPGGLHRHRSELAHPALEAGEEAVELAKATGQQIVHVAGLRDARSEVEIRGIRIALDDRDPVDDVAEHTGGAHPGHAATDHESAGRWHGVPPSGITRSRRRVYYSIT